MCVWHECVSVCFECVNGMNVCVRPCWFFVFVQHECVRAFVCACMRVGVCVRECLKRCQEKERKKNEDPRKD